MADPPRIQSDPIGSDRTRLDPICQTVRRGGLRRTQADPKKVRQVRLSPPRIRSDPIGSAMTVRQKKFTTASAGKRLYLSPPIGGLNPPTGGLCLPKEEGGQSLSILSGGKSPLPGGLSPWRTFSQTLTLTLTLG